jgi:16S rRNA A1518/A1519 N6-dimethyltransferase RsmA/KsgA/DIM1 with predicted DNA glycosylase/AP lyase activity
VLDYQPHPEVNAENWATFQRIVHAGFGQRRKQFAKLLRQDGFDGKGVEKAFATLQLVSSIRAEALSLEQFLRLTRELG